MQLGKIKFGQRTASELGGPAVEVSGRLRISIYKDCGEDLVKDLVKIVESWKELWRIVSNCEELRRIHENCEEAALDWQVAAEKFKII